MYTRCVMNEHLNEETIFEYLDGEIKDQKVISHIENCKVCSEKLKYYIELDNKLRTGLPSVEVSADFTSNVMDKIIKTRKPVLQRILIGSIASAALILITASVFLAFLPESRVVKESEYINNIEQADEKIADYFASLGEEEKEVVENLELLQELEELEELDAAVNVSVLEAIEDFEKEDNEEK